MGAFVISKRFNDEYKFVFTSRKGKPIFSSTSYELKFECEDGIALFKENIDNCQFVKHKSASGKYFFKLMLNDVLFAISRKYSTELMLAKGINEITKYAVKSETLDFSESDSIFG
ncbi:MAG: DUF1508 domain-containing protein [Flavobacterium sp.]|nr:DUF1508 domain-containing protein [Flavobacterium sp.]